MSVVDVCSLEDVSYSHRVDNPSSFNFCPVPDGTPDAFLFGSVAIACACLLHFKGLSAVVSLAVGAATEVAIYAYNFGRIGNAFTLWLGVNPPELLLYAFLPPLLLDAALGLDWFVFKRVAAHAASFAVFVVLATAALLSPFMLYVLGLGSKGWKVSACSMP